MAIARLDTAASGNTDGASYTVSAGTNRCLVVAITQEGTITEDSLTVTWGGQSMTKAVTEFLEAGTFDLECYIFYLLDSGIQAASGSTITITGEVTSFTWHAISYTGVHQDGGAITVPETNTDSINASTPNPLTGCDINAAASNAVVALGASGTTTVGSWGGTNPLTEQTELIDASSTTYASLGDRLVTATETVDVERTWLTQNRAAVCAIELAATGNVYINDATTLDGGEVLQTYPGAANWSDTSIDMQTVPDTTGLTPPLYVIVELPNGSIAYRAVTVGGTTDVNYGATGRGIMRGVARKVG